MIQYADIVYDTIVDGIGLRNTLYVSGCSHNCEGCHNKPLQDYNYGKKVFIDDLANLLNQDNNDITFSGGEPFEQATQLNWLIAVIDTLRDKAGINRPNIWVYSGYTFEEIIVDPVKKELLENIDVLVDGRFEIDKRNITLPFRGSTNQRIIDIQESLKGNGIVEYNLGG